MTFTPLVRFDSATSGGKWFIVDEAQQVLLLDGQIPQGDAAPISVVVPHPLGLDNDKPTWAAQATPNADLPPDATWIHLRQLFGMVSDTDWALAGRAMQVITWDRDHKFCGRCGETTEPHRKDRAKRCPACGLMAFPRLSPAVIMLVERGDEVLLAWGRQFPGRFFSALAGFVEPGESLEETVAREVMEETSIEVGNIRYFGSQPWPFPHSMMIGFNAVYAGGELEIDPEEIVEAGWFTRTELPPVPTGGMSIAGWLIEDWLKRTA